MKKNYFIIVAILVVGAAVILIKQNTLFPQLTPPPYIPNSPEEIDKNLKEYLALSPEEQAKINSERQKQKERQDYADKAAYIKSYQIEEGVENPHGVADSYTNDKLGIGLKFPQKFSFSAGKEISGNTYYVAFCYDVKDDCFALNMTNSLSLEKISNFGNSLTIDKDFKRNLCKIKKCPDGTIYDGDIVTYGNNKYFAVQLDIPDRFGGTYRIWHFDTMIGATLYSFRFNKHLTLDPDKDEPTAAARKYILENFTANL